MTGSLQAGVRIEGDAEFKTQVEKELTAMKEGKRGVVSQALIQRLETAPADTTIKPITQDESTWHPNDRRGTRSHVVPGDTKMRGEMRESPTSATLYLSPPRINPKLSLFKLGTFVYELAMATDLNWGEFSGDYKTREKRAIFYRNAWCDSQKFSVIELSGRIPTPEYKKAKELGLLVPENASQFPILSPEPTATP